MTLAELYRDPVYDGATDPTVVIARDGWWMFYTQRRATHPDPGPGVAWVHGSRIGVAHSPDGVVWDYAGTLEPEPAGLRLTAGAPPEATDRTHWAPEVIHDGTLWRMYLTEIDGVPDRWPGHARHIVEYVSDDLVRWQRRGPLALASDRVIDAAVARCPDGRWRLWYKDEAADSVTKVAASADLERWTDEGTAIGGRPHEGPYAFELAGWWWLIVDEWRGMGVYRSDDAIRWQRQGGPDAVVLGAGAGAGAGQGEGAGEGAGEGPGEVAGAGFGHHGAAVRDGGRVWFYFFSHPALAAAPGPVAPDLGAPDLAAADPGAPDSAAAPDLAAPDLAAPDLAAPDLAVPDPGAPGPSVSDPAAPDPADETVEGRDAIDDRRCAIYRVELRVEAGLLTVVG